MTDTRIQIFTGSNPYYPEGNPEDHFYQVPVDHKCLEEGTDPLEGILNETALKLACCPIQRFLMLNPKSKAMRAALTPFGRRMFDVGEHFKIDIHSILLHWGFSNSRLLPIFNNAYRSYSTVFKDDDLVQWVFDECDVCSSSCRFVRKPPCCRKSICQPCWNDYLRTIKLSNIGSESLKPSSYNLDCYGCNKVVPYRQALAATEPSLLSLLRKDGSDSLAHCPICLETVDDKPVPKGGNKYIKVICKKCGHAFCARCGAEQHQKNSCYEIKHDAGLTVWMKQQHPNHNQLQISRFCPNCHIPIVHHGGCPWMTCVCGTEFCFACGVQRNSYNAWHREYRMRLVPIVTCPKMWKSQAVRVASQSAFTVAFILVIAPTLIVFLPVIFILFLIAFTAFRLKQILSDE